MTNNEINVAIAEACGLDTKRYQVGGIFCYRDKEGNMRATLPNYCTDLNAMHEAEETLEPEQREDYEAYLNTQVHAFFSDWHLIHATARQRAEAFLRSLNKWKD